MNNINTFSVKAVYLSVKYFEMFIHYFLFQYELKNVTGSERKQYIIISSENLF